jgi:hypothetical protein
MNNLLTDIRVPHRVIVVIPGLDVAETAALAIRTDAGTPVTSATCRAVTSFVKVVRPRALMATSSNPRLGMRFGRLRELTDAGLRRRPTRVEHRAGPLGVGADRDPAVLDPNFVSCNGHHRRPVDQRAVVQAKN